MQRLVCRIPLEQTEAGAATLGKLIVQGLNGAEFRQSTRSLVLSDATRGAIVEWLNLSNGSRMRERDLLSIDMIPLRLDNKMRFGDVIAEEN
jgi:hypothetical protein